MLAPSSGTALRCMELMWPPSLYRNHIISHKILIYCDIVIIAICTITVTALAILI